MYSIGDVVSVNDDRGEVAKMQKGHGDWVEDMNEVLCSLHVFVRAPPIVFDIWANHLLIASTYMYPMS